MIKLLYGPPGTGKSTTSRQLGGLDLETVEKPDRMVALKDALLTHEKDRVYYIGMADVSVKAARLLAHQLGIPVTHTLILPPPDTYYARRRKRDMLHPKKQPQKDYYPHFAARAEEYDEVVDKIEGVQRNG